MLSLFKSFFTLNIDEAWVFLSKLSLLLRGPLLSLSIVFFLDAPIQGLWFTFISLSMIAVAVELGFTTLISQLISHEFTLVRYKSGFILGRKKSRDKFFSLIKYSIKVYLYIVPIAFVVSLLIGLSVFHEENLEVKLAWALFSFISSFSLIVSIFQSIYMGLDKVAFTYKLRTIFGLVLTFSSILLMYFGLNLWSLVISSVIANILVVILLFREAPKFWNQLLRNKQNFFFSWKDKVLKLQGKYAVSWISGYGGLHLFVPFVYSFYGVETAGQLGLAISLISGISNLSLSWVDSVIPKLNILIAKNERSSMNSLFFYSSMKGYFLFVIGALTLITIVYLANYYELYMERILSVYLILLLLISELGIFTVALIGKYLRAHKDEPLFLLSLLHAVLIVLILALILPNSNLDQTIQFMILLNCFILPPLAILIAKNFLKGFVK